MAAMRTPDEIRAMRFKLFEEANEAANRIAARATPMTVGEHELAARLGGQAAALNWVLGEDERPDWNFLDTVHGGD